LGFLCVRAPLLDKLRPSTYGYMALRLPPGGWSEFVASAAGATEVPAVFTGSARKFEGGGTGPLLTALTLTAALRELEAVGPALIEARTCALADALIDGLDHAGVKLVTPRERLQRAGIVTFTTGEPGRDVRLHDALLESGVVTSYRRSGSTAGIRVAPYFYNSVEDLGRLLDVVEVPTR
ncbi:MAG: aminotransferase class V-fold PLP-dependent enzyme, partial [Acidimicrobiales bacterium]